MASAWVRILANIETSAPTTKLSGLPLAKTIAFTCASPSSRERIAESSSSKSGRSVFTGSPGTSMKTVATPSAWTSKRKVDPAIPIPG